MDGAISGEGGTPRLGWLKALTLLLAAVVVTHSTTYLVLGVPGDSRQVASEVGASADVGDRTDAPGFQRIKQVTPEGQLASAGVQAGDAIRFEHPWDLFRQRLPVEETFHLTILRDGRSIPGSFTTGPSSPRGWNASHLMWALSSLFMAAAGLAITLRARNRVGILLGVSLVAMAQVGSFTVGWEDHLVRHFPVMLLFAAIMVLAPVGIFAFALLHRAEAIGRRVSPLWGALFWLYVVVAAGDWLNGAYAVMAMTDSPLPTPQIVSLLLYWAAPFAALGLLIRAAFETNGRERTRFGFLAAALGAYFGGTSVTGMIINLTGNDFSLNNPVAVLGHVLAVSGVAIFLYAALRHRVVDLGFAVNRTLVFGVLSTTLLFTFFLLEWGAEQVIPSDMREASLLASAGIAFALFLVFHKVRHWVEKGVETLFFRRWRNQEADLRRFVRQAAFVTRADTLRASAIAAFSKFADGAGVALYHRQGGAYVRAEGEVEGLAAALDLDMPALVRLRAELEPLEEDLPPGAALMLPLVQRKELTGVFVFAPKPSGELFRPDERETLAEASARIGLDLHALRVEALETESREQRRRADMLERQMQRALKAGARA